LTWGSYTILFCIICYLAWVFLQSHYIDSLFTCPLSFNRMSLLIYSYFNIIIHSEF
jgi:hypothetical protein